MCVIKPIPTNELAAKTKASIKPVYLPGPSGADDAEVGACEAEVTTCGSVAGTCLGVVEGVGLGTNALTGKPMSMWVAAQNQQVPAFESHLK